MSDTAFCLFRPDTRARRRVAAVARARAVVYRIIVYLPVAFSFPLPPGVFVVAGVFGAARGVPAGPPFVVAGGNIAVPGSRSDLCTRSSSMDFPFWSCAHQGCSHDTTLIADTLRKTNQNFDGGESRVSGVWSGVWAVFWRTRVLGRGGLLEWKQTATTTKLFGWGRFGCGLGTLQPESAGRFQSVKTHEAQ